MINIMKRHYIIPNTESIAFRANSVCQTVSPAGPNANVTGPNVGIGGGQDIGNPD